MAGTFLIVLYAFIAQFYFIWVDSCSPLGNGQQQSQQREEDVVGKQLVNVVLQSRLGEGIESKTYNSKHYLKQKGPVDAGDDLNCDFESDCCWTNAGRKKKGRGVDWTTVDDSANMESFDRTFQKKRRPNGHFLVAASPFVDPTVRSEFVSCDILCTDDKVLVSFSHWTTPNVKLEICTQSAFVADPKKKADDKCDDIPSRLSPGPTTMSLPSGEYFVIKFVASNFTDTGGGMAILDDITVTAPPCTRQPQLGIPHGAKTSPSKQKGGKKKSHGRNGQQGSVRTNKKKSGGKVDSATCSKLTCDFEGDTCGFKDANGRIGNRAVHFLHGHIGNETAGIKGAAKGKTYVGGLLRPGDMLALEATGLTIPGDTTLEYQSFVSTPEAVWKVCVNDIGHCPTPTEQGVSVAGDLWKRSRVTLPAQTHTVLLIAENKGSSGLSGVGLDDIELLNGGTVPCSS